MSTDGELGKTYPDGTKITIQGEIGDCMCVILKGRAEVVLEREGRELRLSVLEPGDVFGEMSLFTRAPRSATVRALGEARVLTIDKRGFLKRVHEDPSLAFRILQKMSLRISALNDELARLAENLSSQPMHL